MPTHQKTLSSNPHILQINQQEFAAKSPNRQNGAQKRISGERNQTEKCPEKERKEEAANDQTKVKVKSVNAQCNNLGHNGEQQPKEQAKTAGVAEWQQGQ
ncbi:unnamed protein product [Ceratitis capitata]|uniref:(Mediterranean fruit fly) hypothetical protein n=1 Tax=Ceratitis capitata TaxID=7213 RepID=A0A811VDN2_CERCA|nr:unnamed protein product [Ceratitis capitata]